jgi:hypothetical protein
MRLPFKIITVIMFIPYYTLQLTYNHKPLIWMACYVQISQTLNT